MTDPDTPPTSVDLSSSSSSSSSNNTNNPLDDIFLSPDSQEPSFTSHIARQHTIDGYREGISASKHLHIQSGFDEGYILGAVLGLHIGRLVGCMDGLLGVSDKLKRSAREELAVGKIFGREYFGEDGIWTWDIGGNDHAKKDVKVEEKKKNVEGTELREEKQYNEHDADEEETFEHVVRQHPLIIKWTKIVIEEAKKHGLNLESL